MLLLASQDHLCQLARCRWPHWSTGSGQLACNDSAQSSRAGPRAQPPALPSAPPLSFRWGGCFRCRPLQQGVHLPCISFPKFTLSLGWGFASAHSVVAFLLSLSKVKGSPGPAPAADVASDGPLHLPWTEVCAWCTGQTFQWKSLRERGRDSWSQTPPGSFLTSPGALGRQPCRT